MGGVLHTDGAAEGGGGEESGRLSGCTSVSFPSLPFQFLPLPFPISLQRFHLLSTLNNKLQITTLTTSHLLQRIAPPDRIDDASSTYKVGRGVTYEAVLELARGKDVGVSLGDFLWESWN